MADSKRKLTVTSCEEKHRGTNKNGKEYVIYEVAAVDESGAPVDAELRAFAELPIGELQVYEVETYDHPKYGRSYTLKLPNTGSRLGPKVDELRNRIERLEQRVGQLEAASSGPQSAPSAAAAAGGDPEDIPF